jgi:hypothetical protein
MALDLQPLIEPELDLQPLEEGTLDLQPLDEKASSLDLQPLDEPVTPSLRPVTAQEPVGPESATISFQGQERTIPLQKEVPTLQPAEVPGGAPLGPQITPKPEVTPEMILATARRTEEATALTDRFKMAVELTSDPAKLDRLRQDYVSQMERLGIGVVHEPPAEQVAMRGLIPFSAFGISDQEAKMIGGVGFQRLAAADRAVLGLAEGLTAPAALAAPLAPRATAGIFAGQMAGDVGNLPVPGFQPGGLASKAGEASVTGTPGEKVEAFAGLGLTTVFTGLAGAHAIGGKTAPGITPVEFDAAHPVITPQAKAAEMAALAAEKARAPLTAEMVRRVAEDTQRSREAARLQSKGAEIPVSTDAKTKTTKWGRKEGDDYNEGMPEKVVAVKEDDTIPKDERHYFVNEVLSPNEIEIGYRRRTIEEIESQIRASRNAIDLMIELGLGKDSKTLTDARIELERLNGELQRSTKANPVPGPIETEAAGTAETVESPAPPTEEPARVETDPVTGDMIGMGAASVEEFPERKAENATATKFRQIDKEREQRGLEPITKPLMISDQEAVNRALEEIDRDPAMPERLVDESLTSPKPLNHWETQVLNIHRIDLRHELGKTLDAIISAQDEGRIEAADALQIMRAELSDRLDRVEHALRATGSEAGRAFRLRRLFLNEDYSLAGVERQLRAAKGGPLSPEELAEAKSLSDEILNTEKTADKAQEESETRARENGVDSAVTGARNKKVKSPQDVIDEATDRIKGKFATGKRAEIFSDVDKLVRALVTENPKIGREALIDRVHGILQQFDPQITRLETMDAISGRGIFTLPSQDSVSMTVRDLKAQVRLVGHQIDVEAGRPLPRTGMQRDKLSDAARREMQKLQELKRKYGVKVTDPKAQLESVLQARKTYYRNRLADLAQEIATREKTVKNKSPSPTDPELEAMKVEYDLLKKQHEEIFGGREMTDEQRVKIAIAGAQRIETLWKARLESARRGIYRIDKKVIKISNAEIEAIKARTESIREEIVEMKASDEAYQSAISAEKAKKVIEDFLGEKTESLDKAIAAFDRRKASESPEGEAEAERRKLVQKIVENARKPRLTREEIELKILKARLAKRTAELAEKTAKGDFSVTPKRKIVADRELELARAKHARAKFEFEKAKERARLQSRSAAERVRDNILKWRRQSLLSGITSLVKLTSAAVERVGFTGVEEAIGRGLGGLPGVREIAQRAPREGGGSLKVEASALSDSITRGMKDAAAILRTGKSEMDLLYGEKIGPEDRVWTEFFGRLHGALKAGVKRNEFSRSLQKRIEFAAKTGADVTDPLVQTRLAMQAYADANRSIFLNENAAVTAYRIVQRYLELKLGKGASGLLQWALPIVRVPTNIVAESLVYAAGSVTGSAKVIQALRNGAENLKPEEADAIMRQLKKGSIGGALLLLGYFNAESVGGYYHPGEKRDDDDVAYGGLRLFGVDVPKLTVHNPALEMLQLGATVRKVAESKIRQNDSESRGLPSGIITGVLGLAEETPFLDLNPQELLDPRKQDYWIGGQVRSALVPALVQNVATFTDRADGKAVKRKPETLMEHVKLGIPGLRETVQER